MVGLVGIEKEPKSGSGDGNLVKKMLSPAVTASVIEPKVSPSQ